MRRTKAQAQETREQLMLAALDVFYERGVGRASLHEIAQAAGVTRGALYWHFKNKEDLFEALFAHIFDNVSCRLEEDIQTGAANMLQSLRQAFINIFERLEHDEQHRKFSAVLHLKCEHTTENAAVVAVMNRYFNMWHQQIRAALRMCVSQGHLPAALDLDFACTYIKTAVFGLLDLWLWRPQSMQLSEAAPRMIDTALHTLQHSPSLLKSAAASATPT